MFRISYPSFSLSLSLSLSPKHYSKMFSPCTGMAYSLSFYQFDATSSKALWEVEIVSDNHAYGGFARVRTIPAFIPCSFSKSYSLFSLFACVYVSFTLAPIPSVSCIRTVGQLLSVQASFIRGVSCGCGRYGRHLGC